MFPVPWGYLHGFSREGFLVLCILAHNAISPAVGMLRESSLSTCLFSLDLKDFHHPWDLCASLLVETGEGFV